MTFVSKKGSGRKDEEGGKEKKGKGARAVMADQLKAQLLLQGS